jgi:Lrp/AsnC family transcriptional regulator, leucine-responsive regulatory protein
MPKKPTTRGLDRIDRQILRILQRDGRISNVDLAKAVYLSPTPCLERVRRLEREGYIEGYSARLNPRKLGAGMILLVELTLDRTTPDMFARFHETIAAIPEVMECFMVAGGFDYMLKIRVADMIAYRALLGDKLTALPGVLQTHTYVVMEEVKNTSWLPSLAD